MPDAKKPITEKDAIAMFLAGHPVVLGEYRSSEAEVINWRDKTTGKALSAPVLRHVVEFGSKSVIINERVEENFDILNYRSPYRKGSKVLVELASMESQRGVISCRGNVIPVSGSNVA